MLNDDGEEEQEVKEIGCVVGTTGGQATMVVTFVVALVPAATKSKSPQIG